MRYRKDIQLLRGISVLMVVLYHLEVGGLESGFLGVDVFFVISGFLMTVLYDDKVKFKDFLVRRARRLLPAYFVTILVTLIAAFIITIPNEFKSVTTQSIFATFLISNIGFWQDNSYFASTAFQPLLHLWSLGVEIQFYVLAPFLFKIFNKRRTAYPICLLLSLAACFYIVGISPKTAFFITILRLWEFLIGYGVATYLTDNGKVRSQSLSWLGGAALVAILAIPMLKVDGKALSFANGHPGMYALFVCCITSLVLAFGVPKPIENSPVGDFLELAGKYSYSIYLVHFPVIVLFLYQPFSGTIIKPSNWFQSSILIVLMLVLSILMYHFVENPIRSKKKTPAYKLWIVLSSSILLVAFTAGNLQQLRFSDAEAQIFAAGEDRSIYRCGKLFRVMHPSSLSCELTQNTSNPNHRILLVGNSHADAIKTTFSSVASDANINVRFMVENNPLMRGGLKPKAILKEAIDNKVDTIVLHYNPSGVNIPAIKELVDLSSSQKIKTIFIMPVPTWGLHVPQALYKNLRYDAKLPHQSLQDYQKFNQQIDRELSTIKSDSFKIYQVASTFCQDDCSISSTSGKPYYFDGGHLTLTGSEQLRSVFEHAIEDSSQFAIK